VVDVGRLAEYNFRRTICYGFRWRKCLEIGRQVGSLGVSDRRTHDIARLDDFRNELSVSDFDVADAGVGGREGIAADVAVGGSELGIFLMGGIVVGRS